MPRRRVLYTHVYIYIYIYIPGFIRVIRAIRAIRGIIRMNINIHERDERDASYTHPKDYSPKGHC